MKGSLWFIALKYLYHSATLYHVGEDELHVVFDSKNAGDDLRAAIDDLNALRTRIPWIGNCVIQFGIAGEGRWAEKGTSEIE